MKIKFIASVVLFAAAFVSVHAGTDSKDMKEMVTPPTLRPEAGPYVGVYGGAQFATDYGNQRQTFTGTAGSPLPAGSTIIASSNITSDWGGVGGIKAGYNFESFPICDTLSLRLQPAVEAEALYLGTTSTTTLSASGVSASENTSYNSAAWFVNGILRFKNESIVTPYVGLGVGGEYLTTHADATTNVPGVGHVTGIDGSDVDFAGQALAGFDVTVAPHFDIFTEYKFIDAFGTDIKTANIAGSGIDYRFKPDQIQQHLIVAGLKYNF